MFYGRRIYDSMYIVSQKMDTSTIVVTCQILVDFQNSFTRGLSSEFVAKQSLKIPPNLKCVAALPCEIFMLKLARINK